MNLIEKMQSHCRYWENMYGFYGKTKELVGSKFPFKMIEDCGVLFTSENSTELKSDENLILNKAIKRIGKIDDVDYIKTFSIAVKVAFSEKSDKVKLFHGLIYNEESHSNFELTWLVINDKVIDFKNNIRGNIPEGYTYFGIEIPKKILHETILSGGFGIQVELPDFEYKPNPSTIFMKCLPKLLKFYGQTNNKKNK